MQTEGVASRVEDIGAAGSDLGSESLDREIERPLAEVVVEAEPDAMGIERLPDPAAETRERIVVAEPGLEVLGLQAHSLADEGLGAGACNHTRARLRPVREEIRACGRVR